MTWTQQDEARNQAAIRNLAGRLEALGYDGDDVHTVAEHLAVNLLADGYRPIEPTPGPRPATVATEAQRQAALAAIRETLNRPKETL